MIIWFSSFFFFLKNILCFISLYCLPSWWIEEDRGMSQLYQVIWSPCRECGWRNNDSLPTCQDPCVVCLERKCTVAAEGDAPENMQIMNSRLFLLYLTITHDVGCGHEFCTKCALYLCSMNSSSTVSLCPPGSIACPLCRKGIVSFVKLPGTKPLVKEIARTSLALSLCTCSGEGTDSTTLMTPFCKPEFHCSRISPIGSSFRSLSCQRFSSVKLNSSLCMGAPDTSPSLVPCTVDRNLQKHLARCSRSGLRRSASHSESRRSWFSALNQYVATASGCWLFRFLLFSFFSWRKVS